VGTPIDVKVGTDVIDKQVTAESAVTNLLTPLVVKDIFEAMKEQGMPATVALSMLAILGFGMQTFDPKKRRRDDRRGFFSVERLKEKVGLGTDRPTLTANPFTSKKESELTQNPF